MSGGPVAPNKKKLKDPAGLAKHTKQMYDTLSNPKAKPKDTDKAVEQLSVDIATMKAVLYGDGSAEPNQDHIGVLCNEVYGHDLIKFFVSDLAKLEFEARKDCGLVFNNILRRSNGSRMPTVEYIEKSLDIIDNLMNSYKNVEISLNAGPMLRECIKYEPLAKYLLHNEALFYSFFGYVEESNFDVASDSFASFKELLTRHKQLVAEYLEKDYDKFFSKYDKLLHSENYVTKRQSLKLLGELLLDRANFNIMTKFISNAENLKLMMMMLRDKSKSIQFEAFHVFKVFVANPNKAPAILDILLKNQQRLVQFLQHFHNHNEDDQFNDEKAFLIKQIEGLQPA